MSSAVSLYAAILDGGHKNAPFVVNHLKRVGIRKWEDCTKVRLSRFPGQLLAAGVCQSSACQYVAVLKAALNRYAEAGVIPCANVRDALKCRNEKTQKVYLTEDELAQLEEVEAGGPRERFVQLCFLISAKTGMRMSDTLRVSSRNIQGGYLRYVSKKTSIEACVPVSDKTAAWIREVNAISVRPGTSTYELMIKGLCRRAGITSDAKVFKAGKERANEKWNFVTSHTARVTFCTLLSQKGVPIQDIATMAGHSNTTMTENYIVRTVPKVNAAAMAFLA